MHEYYAQKDGVVVCCVGTDPSCGIHDLPAFSELPEEGKDWPLLFVVPAPTNCPSCAKGGALEYHYDTGIRMPIIPILSSAI